MVWPAIAAAAAPSVVGGVFSLFNKKKQRTTPDLVGLRREAEKAGFNPAFALSATGGGGVPASNPMSSLDFLAHAIGAGAQAYLEQDPIAASTRELESRLLAAEVGLAERQLGDMVAPRRSMRPYEKGTGGPQSGDTRPRMALTPLGGPVPVALGTPPYLKNPQIEYSLQPVQTSAGPRVDVPIGPDIDEMASGYFIEAAGRAKAAGNRTTAGIVMDDIAGAYTDWARYQGKSVAEWLMEKYRDHKAKPKPKANWPKVFPNWDGPKGPPPLMKGMY